jgi:hypothetical protein
MKGGVIPDQQPGVVSELRTLKSPRSFKISKHDQSGARKRLLGKQISQQIAHGKVVVVVPKVGDHFLCGEDGNSDVIHQMRDKSVLPT